jgi:hypothetical protein
MLHSEKDHLSAEDYLLNAIGYYNRANSDTHFLRLAYIDTAEALRRLGENAGFIGSTGPEAKSYTAAIREYLSDLVQNRLITYAFKKDLLRYYGERNPAKPSRLDGLRDKAVHQMLVPDRHDTKAFIELIIQLFSNLQIIPIGYDSRPLAQFLIENFRTEELGFSILSPSTWSIREFENTVCFTRGESSIWVRRWLREEEEKMIARVKHAVKNLLQVTHQPITIAGFSANKFQYGYPETSDGIRKGLLYIGTGDCFYEFEYNPGQYTYETYEPLFENMYSSFQLLDQKPVATHDQVVQHIAKQEFGASELTRMTAEHKLRKPVLPIISPDSILGTIQETKKIEAYRRIAEARENSLQQVAEEYTNKNITREELIELVCSRTCAVLDETGIETEAERLYTDILVLFDKRVIGIGDVAGRSTLTLAKFERWKSLRRVLNSILLRLLGLEVDFRIYVPRVYYQEVKMNQKMIGATQIRWYGYEDGRVTIGDDLE